MDDDAGELDVGRTTRERRSWIVEETDRESRGVGTTKPLPLRVDVPESLTSSSSSMNAFPFVDVVGDDCARVFPMAC